MLSQKLFNKLMTQRFYLAFYLKSVLAFRADYEVLTLCLWQTKNDLAGGTFSVNVRFSVAEFVAP